jgi:tetratricopeptide (TPR) repeat protein
MNIKFCLAGVLLASLAFAQQTPSSTPNAAAAPPPQETPSAPSAARTPDRAAAYYHYSLAHIYEELVAMYGRAELANKAIEEYKLAIQNDPNNGFLNAGLAELLYKTNRISDAVREAQDVIKRSPNNVEAHRLLGRIYVRTCCAGDLEATPQSAQMRKLAIEQYKEIVRLDPKSVDDHIILGRLYGMDHELPKAETEFKAATALQPSSEEAVTTLAYLYNEAGEQKKAIEILNAFPEPARSAKFYNVLGYTYEQQKDFPKAVDAYRHAVDEDKDNLDAMRGLAQNLMNQGKVEEALQEFRVIADADPQDVNALEQLAELYRRNGKYDQALEVLNKADGLVPDSLEIPYKRAQVYEAQGRFDDAAQILQGLLQKTASPTGKYSSAEKNNRGIFLERLGNLYRQQGKTQLAVETYRKSIDLGDDNAVRGYVNTIETYRDAKQWNEATAAARDAVAKLPENRGLKLELCTQLADTGKPDEAISLAHSMLTNAPEDRDVYLALAEIENRLKRWKEAEEDANKAVQLSQRPEDRATARFVVGAIYERQKKYEPAEEAFQQVIRNDPQNAGALNYLGYMLADRGVRLDEAIGYIKRAVEIDPQNGAYLDSLGWAYFKAGNYDMAEQNLRKASERIGNDATVQDHLGELFNKTGKLRLAAMHWERALAEWNRSVPADVDTADVARVQKKLESTKVKLAKEGQASTATKQQQ